MFKVDEAKWKKESEIDCLTLFDLNQHKQMFTEVI